MSFPFAHARIPRRIRLIFSAVCLAGALPAPAVDEKDAPLRMRIGYVSEMPLSWRVGTGDPLQSWAKNLSVLFAGAGNAQENAYTATNLMGAETWEELSGEVSTGSVDLLPMRATDFILNGEKDGLVALLTAGNAQSAAGTRFVLITSAERSYDRIMDLEGETVLVDRDGCGDLVDYWLDVLIAKSSGSPRRLQAGKPGERPQKPFAARFRTVGGASEAVLPVFFKEVAACVVSESALAEVVALNRGQIPQRLKEPIARSPYLATHVLAARPSLSPVDKAKAAEIAARESLMLPSGERPLTPASAESLAPLRELLTTWRSLRPNAPPPAIRVPADAGAAKRSATPAALTSNPARE